MSPLFALSEYLADASIVCAPKAAKAWLEQQQQRCKENQIEAVLNDLKPYREKHSRLNQATPVRAAYRYISNRLDQLDYQGTLRANLPLGSGEIESAHRYVIQQRLKRPGAWWSVSHAGLVD
jgi:hypothetical protein